MEKEFSGNYTAIHVPTKQLVDLSGTIELFFRIRAYGCYQSCPPGYNMCAPEESGQKSKPFWLFRLVTGEHGNQQRGRVIQHTG